MTVSVHSLTQAAEMLESVGVLFMHHMRYTMMHVKLKASDIPRVHNRHAVPFTHAKQWKNLTSLLASEAFPALLKSA